MILDPNGMPILQPTIDNAETATFNDAFAAIGNAVVAVENAVVAVENVRQIKTYKWADNAARTAQTGMGAGDEGYQTDTDTYYTYDGSAWIVVGVPDTGWQVPTLLNGWTNFGVSYQTARYRRKGGVVYIQGLLKDGTTGVSIFNLPVGFRPAAKLQVPTILGGGAVGRIDIEPDGNILGLNVSASATSITFPPFPL